MSRILNAIETIAGLALAAVAVLIFTTAVLRYVFGVNLPDGFDFARYLQGIAIVWGLCVATWRGSHICVDIVHEFCGPGAQRAIDLLASIVTAGFFCLLAFALLTRLPSMMASGQGTADLRLAIWPFYLAVTLGGLAAALVSLIVVLRSLRPTFGTTSHG